MKVIVILKKRSQNHDPTWYFLCNMEKENHYQSHQGNFDKLALDFLYFSASVLNKYWPDWYPWARRFLAIRWRHIRKKRGILICRSPFRPSEALSKERTESEYPRWSIYNAPKSVREGIGYPRSTLRDVYTTRKHSPPHLSWFEIWISDVQMVKTKHQWRLFRNVVSQPTNPKAWVLTLQIYKEIVNIYLFLEEIMCFLTIFAIKERSNLSKIDLNGSKMFVLSKIISELYGKRTRSVTQ